MSTDLLFLDPEFLDGINITVRRGRKWDDIVHRLPYLVDLKETGDDEVLGRAEIVGKMVVRFADLAGEEELLWLEHAEDCTSYDGLLDAMCDAYGDDFSEDEEVTVLFFREVGDDIG